jgi:bifunctional DNA-binding transcriptional regulator/antitoxin component of YhaV-PrlF toxin-antitoxin module
LWDVYVGEDMSTARVDSRHRIVIDKQTRSITQIKEGDIVIIEPLDSHSFKVNVLDFTGKLEDDPEWQAIRKPAKIRKFIPPEKLEEIMDEAWRE